MRRAWVTLLLLLVAWAGPAGAQEYGGAEAKLKCPGTVSAGTTVTIQGSGFAPAAVVKVEFDARLRLPTVSVTADLDGKISLPVTISDTTDAGTYDISASGRGRDGGKLKLKCSIKVTVDTILSDGVSVGFDRPAESGGGTSWSAVALALVVLGLALAVVLERRRSTLRREKP